MRIGAELYYTMDILEVMLVGIRENLQAVSDR